MSLLEKTRRLLQTYGISPKKSFGQNFLIEPTIFERLAEYASINSKDVILDIGAGLGFLTCFLAHKCQSVLAVEIDKKLVRVLHAQVANLRNIRVFHGDVFREELAPFNKVVSVPPYNISSALMLWLFEKKFDCAVLVFQKEFAERIVASVGSENYGWLSVVAYYYADVELLDEVPKWMFYPQPEVDSIIVRLKLKTPPFPLKDRIIFKELVKSLFTRRNRKVRNAIIPFLRFRNNMTMRKLENLTSIPFLNKRVRELAPEDFGLLTNVFAE